MRLRSLSTQTSTLRRAARRSLGAGVAVAVVGTTLATVASVAPAGAATGARNFACTAVSPLLGTKTPTFSVNLDTNAPAKMYVGDAAAPLTLTSTVNMPRTNYGGSWHTATKRQVEGPATYQVGGVSGTTTTHNLKSTLVGAFAGAPDPWPATGSGAMGTFTPTTPGDASITTSGFSVNYTWRDYFGNTPERETVTCQAPGGSVTIDTVVVVARSTTALTVTPAAVQQNHGPTATATVTVPAGNVAGTVEFIDVDTGAVLGTSTLGGAAAASKTATLALPALAVGNHAVHAVFTPSDTKYYEASTSPTKTWTVNAARATTTTLSVSPTQIQPSETATATATVTAATGTGTPTGTMEFSYDLDGTPQTKSAPIGPDGTATATLSGLPAGDYPVKARYVPADPDTWAASTSSSVLLRVVKRAAVTTTGLAFTENPAYTTDPVEAVASVSVVDATAPQGEVLFTISNETIFETRGPVAVGSDGEARVDLSDLPAGAYDVTADFTPTNTSDQTVSTSGARQLLIQTPPVQPAVETSTALSVAPTSLYVGESATATATVTAASGNAQPQGTVEFNVDGTSHEVALVGGTASLPLTNLALGNHTVTARFIPADPAAFVGSSDPDVVVVEVSKRPAVTTTTQVDLSPDAITTDGSATVTATVGAQSGAPDGTVEFTVTKDGVNTVHRRVWRPGGVSIELADLGVGTYQVSARFIPASADDFTTSTSNVKSLTVSQAPASATTTVLALSRSNATTAQTVEAIATVSAGRGVPAGTVAFTYGTQTVSAPVINGVATAQLTGLTPGTFPVRAVYTPADETPQRFLTSTSNSRELVVSAAPAGATVTDVLLDRTTTAANQSVSARVVVTGPEGPAVGSVEVTFQGRSVTAQLVDGRVDVVVPTDANHAYAVGTSDVVATFRPASSELAPSTGRASLKVIAAAGDEVSTTVLTLDRASVRTGQTATATAVVSGAGAAAAGRVVFGFRGQETSVALSSGSATLELQSDQVGTFPVSARFEPTVGSGVAASQAQPVDLTVVSPTAAASATSLDVSTTAADFGDAVIATATVTVSRGTPAGAVRFLDGTTVLGEVPVDGTGKAKLTTTSLAAGKHDVRASFVPSAPGSQVSSVSQTRSVTVTATSAVSLTLTPASVVRGGSVNAVAAVTGAGAPVAGNVTFAVGGREVRAVVSGGAASASIPTDLAPGTYDVIATYTPADSAVRPARPSVQQLTITAASTPGPSAPAPKATSVALAPSLAEPAYGQPASVTATVTAGVVGYVQFSVAGRQQDVPVSGASAVFTLPKSLPVGTSVVHATFVPNDPAAWTQSSGSTQVSVVKDASSPRFARRWSPKERLVQVRTTVAGVVGHSAGSGKVKVTLSLKDAKGKLRRIAVKATTLDANGFAETKLATKGKRGTFVIKVSYAGSSTLLPSSSTKIMKVK